MEKAEGIGSWLALLASHRHRTLELLHEALNPLLQLKIPTFSGMKAEKKRQLHMMSLLGETAL